MEIKYTLKKSRAKQRIEISPDYSMDPDGWFYRIAYIENKTGKLAHEHCVIEKDIPTWLDGLIRDGWQIESTN